MSHSCCYLILGDQLNWDSLVWESIDAKNDVVLMCEVQNASLKPRSSKQRTTLFLSAMRHFAQEVKDKGYSLIYHSKWGSLPAKSGRYWSISSRTV
jgi:deoxyribodipyrimidine photolyase-like uncharacterized protein